MKNCHSESAQPPSGFTLIEMLAVAAIIGLLAMMVIGIASYTRRSSDVNIARGDMGSIQAAIEVFRSDVGTYPTSTTMRISQTWVAERTNSWMLYVQLQPYYKPPKRMLGTSLGVTYFADPWSGPYNYFCTYPRLPNPSYGHLGGDIYAQDFCAIGGQTNLPTYDLFSYGPDRQTYLPAVWDCPDFLYTLRGAWVEV